MSYRGDDEPEYIDDDEFFDPDDADGEARMCWAAAAHGQRGMPPANRRMRDRANRLAGVRLLEIERIARKPSKARGAIRSIRAIRRRQWRAAKNVALGWPASTRKRKVVLKAANQRLLRRKKRTQARLVSLGCAHASPARKQGREEIRLLRARQALAHWRWHQPPPGRIKGRFGGKASHDDRADKRVKQAEGKRSGQSTVKDSGRHFGSSRGTTKPADARIGAAAQQQGSKSDSGRNRSSKTPRIESTDWLDLDRKLDLIGVGLVFGAIVFVFSALSPEQAAIGSVHTIVGQLLGWGAFAAPATMFAIGMWLIIRHFGDQAPILDPLRISGLALAFLGALVLFQYLDSFSYAEFIGAFTQCSNSSSPACIEALVQQSYESGRGGGLVGGWLYSALVINLTELGGFVMVVMVLTFATMMITRSSMAEIAVVTISLSRSLRTRVGQYAVQRRAARLKAQQQMALAQEDSHVRVSKPQPAQLTGSPQAGRALPEPSAESMPIPVRLREWFGRRGKPEVELEAEAAAWRRPRLKLLVSRLPVWSSVSFAEAGTRQSRGHHHLGPPTL